MIKSKKSMLELTLEHHEAVVAEREAERVAAEKAEQEKQEAERHQLEKLRDERLGREAYAALNPEQQKEFDRRTDATVLIPRMAQQARAEVEKKFLESNESLRQQEMREWIDKHQVPTSNLERTNALNKINQRAAEREALWKKQREQLELSAEVRTDPIERAIHSLDTDGRQILADLLEERPSPVQFVRDIQQESQQREHAERQAELRKGYEAEVMQARGATWRTNILLKWRAKGLEI